MDLLRLPQVNLSIIQIIYFEYRSQILPFLLALPQSVSYFKKTIFPILTNNNLKMKDITKSLVEGDWHRY